MLKRPPENLQRFTRMSSIENTMPLFGIRISTPTDDPFANLVGKDWNTTHWFNTQSERDRAIKEMQREHEYSRRGDKPTLIYETVTRPTKT
jgi:hypothetical protein